MKKTVSFSILFTVLFSLPFQGNAQLNCYSLQAPEITIEGLEKIAILNFQNRTDVNWNYSYKNDNGSQLADYMVALLLEEHRGVYTKEENKANKSAETTDLSISKISKQRNASKYAKGENYMDRYKTNVYTVVERNKLDQIMAEQLLGAAGAISDGDAAKIGQLLGLDVIITGGYTSDIKESVRRSSSSSSVGYVAKIIVSVDVTMKIISVETGEILSMINKTVSKKKTASGKSHSGAKGKLPSRESLVRSSLKDISKQLVSHFSPTFVYQALEVEKPASKGYKEDFKIAKDFVKENDLSNAFLVVKKVYDTDPYDAAMAHNMGVLYEAVGNFEESIEFHKVAYELDDSKSHKEALERALNSKEALEQLGKLGVDIAPYVFDAHAADVLNIVKVMTKGKKDDRWEVYLEPNKGTDVVAKVPGETKFEKIGAEKSFIKIKLLGGKEGYISKENLED